MQNSLLVILSLIVLSGCVGSGGGGSSKTTTTNTNTPNSNPILPAPTPVPTPFVTPTPTPTPYVALFDNLFSSAWHLYNVAQTNFADNPGVAGEDMRAHAAHLLGYTGVGVRIAVSDTALETTHEDLTGNLLTGEHRDYSKASPPYAGDPTPEGTGGDHGTSTTGIIVAKAGNTVGSRGVAYGAKAAGFKYIYSATTSRQLDQANGNFDIFSYSYGSYSCIFYPIDSNYLDQLEYGVKNLRNGKGAVYVKAAGNEYISTTKDCFASETTSNYYYGNANLEGGHDVPWQIIVGSLDARGISASYSTPGSSLWISAPGGEFGSTNPAIITTDRTGCDKGYAKDTATINDFENGDPALNPNCNYTSTFNGTSSATPMVAGAVALILQANPNLTWRDVKHILASTARKVDPNRAATAHPGSQNLAGHIYQDGWITNAAGYNFHNWYGFGGVDSAGAVQMASSYTANNFGGFKEFSQGSGSVNANIPDASSVGASDTINFGNSIVVESVQIELDVEHTFIGDLGVEITSPMGTKSILMNINSGVKSANISDEHLLTNAFYGEQGSGSWTVKIIDGLADDTGMLKSWKLKVYGH